jgi:uncharacterized protein
MDIAFWDAIYLGDASEVARMIHSDPSLVQTKEDDGTIVWTPLIVACREGHLEVARCLLLNGANVNDIESEGGTALFWASARGDPKVVQLLLDCGGDHTKADEYGNNPLMEAASSGHLEATRVLLDHDSRGINERGFEGRTALWWACFQGRPAVVSLLLERRADHTIPDQAGMTALAIAKWKGVDACIKLMEVRHGQHSNHAPQGTE